MKVEIECAPCLLSRGYKEILEATNEKNLQFEAMSALTQLLNKEFKPNAIPACIGTKRDRLIRRITGNKDPYAKKKCFSNECAMHLLPQAKQFIAHSSSSQDRFERACLCAIVGNIMEFDILNHQFKFEEIATLITHARDDLAVNELSNIYGVTRKSRKILYLTDNTGEIAFDTLLVGELSQDAHVTVAVKESPVLNDATMQDAENVGMDKVADKLITTGTDTVGIILEECSREFLTIYESVDLIVAKGMGYVETISELQLKKPHAMFLRTKCTPVAKYFGTTKSKNIAKLLT